MNDFLTFVLDLLQENSTNNSDGLANSTISMVGKNRLSHPYNLEIHQQVSSDFIKAKMELTKKMNKQITLKQLLSSPEKPELLSAIVLADSITTEHQQLKPEIFTQAALKNNILPKHIEFIIQNKKLFEDVADIKNKGYGESMKQFKELGPTIHDLATKGCSVKVPVTRILTVEELIDLLSENMLRTEVHGVAVAEIDSLTKANQVLWADDTDKALVIKSSNSKHWFHVTMHPEYGDDVKQTGNYFIGLAENKTGEINAYIAIKKEGNGTLERPQIGIDPSERSDFVRKITGDTYCVKQTSFHPAQIKEICAETDKEEAIQEIKKKLTSTKGKLWNDVKYKNVSKMSYIENSHRTISAVDAQILAAGKKSLFKNPEEFLNYIEKQIPDNLKNLIKENKIKTQFILAGENGLGVYKPNITK